jgi:N-acetyl-gamma-glutamyl-phosphate reductase
VTFVPHLVPQSRGILATCYVDLAEDASEEALNGLLNDAYEGEPFVHLVETPPSTKLTWGTNHAFLHVARPRAGQALVLCVIDNMGKGAAGQAIQNMNVALGLRETAGLAGLAVHP